MNRMVELQPSGGVKRSALNQLFSKAVGRLFVSVFGKPKLKPLVDSGPDLRLQADLHKSFIPAGTHHTAVVSNRYFKSAFGNAIVVIAAGALRLRVERDRGTFYYDVAPAHAPDDWIPMDLALAAVAEDVPLRRCNGEPIEEVGRVLQEHIADLQAAFSSQRFPDTRERIDKMRASNKYEWSWRLDKPLGL